MDVYDTGQHVGRKVLQRALRCARWDVRLAQVPVEGNRPLTGRGSTIEKTLRKTVTRGFAFAWEACRQTRLHLWPDSSLPLETLYLLRAGSAVALVRADGLTKTTKRAHKGRGIIPQHVRTMCCFDVGRCGNM